MLQATNNSTWKQGQEVLGVYCGKHFTGRINDNTRGTPDGRNVIFAITLDHPITVYGSERSRIELETNSSNTLYLI